MTERHGLILFAHGARDPRWAEPFERIAASVRSGAPELAVRLAFLEFMAPTLVDAGLALAVEGCTQVDVRPLFLGAGGHVRKDLPLLIDTLRNAAPRVAWQLLPVIGEEASVIEAMARAAATVAAPVVATAPGRTFDLTSDPASVAADDAAA